MEFKTKEPQYQFLIDMEEGEGLQKMGLMSSQVWRDDPRRLGFVLARYKFVSKMLSGKKRVAEIGCADAFGTRVVRQEVPEVVAVDFDPVFIERNQKEQSDKWNIEFRVHDLMTGPLDGEFDAAYSCDVLEHILPEDEDVFVKNIAGSVTANGVCIFGSPSLESQTYASPASKEGHVNCKSGPDLKELMEKHFENVFLFSMNDEVVHTGYYPMAHYLFALCVTPKRG